MGQNGKGWPALPGWGRMMAMPATITLTCSTCAAETRYEGEAPPWKVHDPRIGKPASVTVLMPGPRYYVECPSCGGRIMGAAAPDHTVLVPLPR